MRKPRVACPLGRLDDVIDHVPEDLPAEASIVMPLGPHRIEAVIRVVAQPNNGKFANGLRPFILCFVTVAIADFKGAPALGILSL